MMSRVKQGIIAGLIATATVSVIEAINLFLLKLVVPFPEVIARMVGLPGNILAGWALHFVIGALIMGPAFAWLYPKLPTNTPITRGILFAVACWLGLLVFISMSGNLAILAGSKGFDIFAFMLFTHMIFGGVMGSVFARLLAREKLAHSMIDGAPAH